MKTFILKLLSRCGITLSRFTPTRVTLRVASEVNVSFSDEVICNIAQFYEHIPPFYTDDTPKPLQIAGAWRGDLYKRRKSQIKAIANRDWNSYKSLLNNLFRSELITGMWNYGYFSPFDNTMIPHAMFKDVAHFKIETGRDLTDLTRMQKFSSDWGLHCGGGGVIKYVDPYHGCQAHRILLACDYLRVTQILESDDKSPQVVVDLGSGFGGTASYLLKWSKTPIHLCLVDIPLNLSTAYAYLAAEFPDLPIQLISSLEQLSGYNISSDKSSVVLLPTIFVEEAMKILRPCILHNSASFSEMDLPTVRFYLDVFAAAGVKVIIETNSGLKGSQNHGGHIEVTAFDIEHLLSKDYQVLSRAKVEDVRYVTSTYLRK